MPSEGERSHLQRARRHFPLDCFTVDDTKITIFSFSLLLVVCTSSHLGAPAHSRNSRLEPEFFLLYYHQNRTASRLPASLAACMHVFFFSTKNAALIGSLMSLITTCLYFCSSFSYPPACLWQLEERDREIGRWYFRTGAAGVWSRYGMDGWMDELNRTREWASTEGMVAFFLLHLWRSIHKNQKFMILQYSLPFDSPFPHVLFLSPLRGTSLIILRTKVCAIQYPPTREPA